LINWHWAKKKKKKKFAPPKINTQKKKKKKKIGKEPILFEIWENATKAYIANIDGDNAEIKHVKRNYYNKKESYMGNAIAMANTVINKYYDYPQIFDYGIEYDSSCINYEILVSFVFLGSRISFHTNETDDDCPVFRNDGVKRDGCIAKKSDFKAKLKELKYSNAFLFKIESSKLDRKFLIFLACNTKMTATTEMRKLPIDILKQIFDYYIIGHNKRRKMVCYDNEAKSERRSYECDYCGKSGHSVDNCWKLNKF